MLNKYLLNEVHGLTIYKIQPTPFNIIITKNLLSASCVCHDFLAVKQNHTNSQVCLSVELFEII